MSRTHSTLSCCHTQLASAYSLTFRELWRRPVIGRLAFAFAATALYASCGGDDPPPSAAAISPDIDASVNVTGGSSSISSSPATGGSRATATSGSGGSTDILPNRSAGGVVGDAGSVAAPPAPSIADRCNSLSAAQIQQYADDITAFFTQAEANLDVVGTTVSPLGTIVDWIDPNTQSPTHQLAAAPPIPDVPEMTDPVVTSLETGLLDPWLAAHPNLVPIPRIDVMSQLTQAWRCMSLQDVLSKYGDATDRTAPPTEQNGGGITPDTPWTHHYASTRQYGAVFGTSAILQVTNPRVWRDDEFSLAQVSLASQSTGILQTLEVGWQKSRIKYQDDLPHLFIYYTTNNYGQHGHFLGGYNNEVYGWEQVSHSRFPRDPIVLGSELAITIHMVGGNWWIGINGEWMGYFPGSLFDPQGLGKVGDQVSWYGEILDYRYDNTATYTQMGNGQFAGTNSAFIRNIGFESLNQNSFYTPSFISADKPNCYSILTYPNSGTNWGSYFLYGGPGKGSPTCI